MAALEILEKLKGVDVQSLTPLQRILLITDGTLTEILEAYFLESIQLVKLSQHIILASALHTQLEPTAGEEFLERKILLRGVNSGNIYAYAESLIAFERLGPHLRHELIHSDIPLGRLWVAHRLETFKELIDIRQQPTNNLNHHFECNISAPLLTRTYRVITNTKPVMIISEYFPAG